MMVNFLDVFLFTHRDRYQESNLPQNLGTVKDLPGKDFLVAIDQCKTNDNSKRGESKNKMIMQKCFLNRMFSCDS